MATTNFTKDMTPGIQRYAAHSREMHIHKSLINLCDQILW